MLLAQVIAQFLILFHAWTQTDGYFNKYPSRLQTTTTLYMSNVKYCTQEIYYAYVSPCCI